MSLIQVSSVIQSGFVPEESLCSAILLLAREGSHGDETNCDCGRRLTLSIYDGEKAVSLAPVGRIKTSCSALAYLKVEREK